MELINSFIAFSESTGLSPDQLFSFSIICMGFYYLFDMIAYGVVIWCVVRGLDWVIPRLIRRFRSWKKEP